MTNLDESTQRSEPTTMSPSKHDHFLADAVKPRSNSLGYLDGFRFGVGFFVSGLLLVLITAGLAWGAYMLMQAS